MGRIVLASSSPRRRQLLTMIGLAHEVRPADVEECPGRGEAAVDYALRAARDKALAVAASEPELPVLGADTVVELQGTIFGKPAGPSEAAAMLATLAGKTHQVHTAMALARAGQCQTLVDTAKVWLRPLTSDTIDWYVATGEPGDKAGAYAVQGIGGLFVSRVEGSPQTVIGLAIHRLDELFASCGLSLMGLIS